MHLSPIILCRLTEHCRAEEEIKSNHRKYVSTGSRLAVHIGFTLLTCMHACTHAHTSLHTLNPSSVNPAISMLWCSEADCQHHQVWKRWIISGLEISSALISTGGKQPLVWGGVRVREEDNCACCSTWLGFIFWCSFFRYRMELALRFGGTMGPNTLLCRLRDEHSTRSQVSWWGSCSCTSEGATNKVSL